MEEWETQLCFRSNNRVVRPFDWGLEWIENWPAASQTPRNGHSPAQFLTELNLRSICNSDQFFSYETPRDFRLAGEMVQFTSPVHTPHPENNVVHGQWFPAKKPNGKAVVVLPHWNASFGQHGALCRGLQKLGLSAFRLSLPYHDFRMPPELERADYAVSSNVGRTLQATRQAVIDTRCAVDWLNQQGFERVGIVGTSLGSCYAFLASAHDERLGVNVFNHCSSYFADVVWTGLSTQHIRQGLEGEIDLETLRAVWQAVSPVNYMEHFARWSKKSKFIYATYDTTFLPGLSADVVARIRAHAIDNELVILPCGHYTLGETPFKFIDGYHICAFLKKWL